MTAIVRIRLFTLLAMLGAAGFAPDAAALTCTVSATPSPLAFGSYTVLADAVTTVSITLACTKTANGEKNVAWTLGLSTGSTTGAGGYGNRAMFNGAPALLYNIYTTNAYATIWGDTTGGTANFSGSFTYPTGLAGIGNVQSTTQIGYARVLANQDLAASTTAYATTSAITVQAVAGGTAFNTTTFNVNASLDANCLINAPAGNVGFGTYDPLSGSAATASGSVVLLCTSGTPYTVALSTGAGSYATRTMTNGTDTLNYNLYTTSGYATVFGDGTVSTGTGSGSGTGITNSVGNQKTVSYFGQLPAGQDKSSGSYSDTITVSVNY